MADKNAELIVLKPNLPQIPGTGLYKRPTTDSFVSTFVPNNKGLIVPASAKELLKEPTTQPEKDKQTIKVQREEIERLKQANQRLIDQLIAAGRENNQLKDQLSSNDTLDINRPELNQRTVAAVLARTPEDKKPSSTESVPVQESLTFQDFDRELELLISDPTKTIDDARVLFDKYDVKKDQGPKDPRISSEGINRALKGKVSVLSRFGKGNDAPNFRSWFTRQILRSGIEDKRGFEAVEIIMNNYDRFIQDDIVDVNSISALTSGLKKLVHQQNAIDFGYNLDTIEEFFRKSEDKDWTKRLSDELKKGREALPDDLSIFSLLPSKIKEKVRSEFTAS